MFNSVKSSPQKLTMNLYHISHIIHQILLAICRCYLLNKLNNEHFTLTIKMRSNHMNPFFYQNIIDLHITTIHVYYTAFCLESMNICIRWINALVRIS